MRAIEPERGPDAGCRAHGAEHGGGVEAGLVHELRRHEAEPAQRLDPDRNAEQRRLPVDRCRSHAASTAGTITAPACTGPPSKVSSKSSPCAAVPLTKAAPAALSGRTWPITEQGAVLIGWPSSARLT